MKKIIVFLFLFIVFLNLKNVLPLYSFAETTESADIEKELEDNVNNQLNNIDFSELNKELETITQNNKVYATDSFLDRVKRIINGELNIDYSSFINYLVALIFDNLLSNVPVLCLIVAIAIVCSLLKELGDEKHQNSVSNVVYFICFSIIVVLVFKTSIQFVSITKGTLTSISSQIQIIFPILLTLITSLGGVVSAGIYQPAMALLSTVISEIFISVLVPIFIFSLVFNVVGNISPNIKLEKMSKFFSSLFKWIIGVVFTLFIAFLSVQGLTAITSDNISIKTAKFALKSYVPILGGYLSDGLSLIMASSVLIKNGVGVAGLSLLFSTILFPVLKILVFMMGLKLVAGIIEPLSEKRISNFIYGTSKCLSMLIVCILGMGFMYLISVGLIICSTNIF